MFYQNKLAVPQCLENKIKTGKMHSHYNSVSVLSSGYGAVVQALLPDIFAGIIKNAYVGKQQPGIRKLMIDSALQD